MLVRWVETLHSLTNVDICRCLPLFVGVFLEILNRDSKHDASDATFNQLKTFLKDYE